VLVIIKDRLFVERIKMKATPFSVSVDTDTECQEWLDTILELCVPFGSTRAGHMFRGQFVFDNATGAMGEYIEESDNEVRFAPLGTLGVTCIAAKANVFIPTKRATTSARSLLNTVFEDTVRQMREAGETQPADTYGTTRRLQKPTLRSRISRVAPELKLAE
jgi:hypothetical protein